MDRTPPLKRIKLDSEAVDATALRARRAGFLDSLARPVSPPPGQSGKPVDSNRQAKPSKISHSVVAPQSGSAVGHASTRSDVLATVDHSNATSSAEKEAISSMCFPSPFQLSRIRDLPASENMESVGLIDVLGDPLIKEAWIFNFCFDVDWLMKHFDEDVRDLVQVKIVHGSWRREDINKIEIDNACSRRSNVNTIQAYLPDAFGTHHSKMIVLFRHDDHAQVVIHTANMLEKDWKNMTQAVWRSPLLPLVETQAQAVQKEHPIAEQFKNDLTRYFRAYGSKLKPLVQQLQQYDFSHMKAAIVASVPSKFKISAPDNEVWGHEMLRRKLQQIKSSFSRLQSTPHFVFQVSSVASLSTNWFENTLYSACESTTQSTSIIYPTAFDVANSLDGYSAGGSIHMKAQSPAHLKQVTTLRPQLCRWTRGTSQFRAGRDLAAPHIKTYVRYASKPTKDCPRPDIDWALVTSANLSSQAWGAAPKLAKGEKNAGEAVIHIQSYEIGVLVWPELFETPEVAKDQSRRQGSVRMIPVFREATPSTVEAKGGSVVGFRMPYDLPLTPYKVDDLPWSPQSSYYEPDSHGRVWADAM